MTSEENPYIIGRPIYEQSFFFGREDLFQFIQDNLKKQAQVILLHGQRRIGKSSVLTQIPNFVQLGQFIFVPLSLEGKSQKSLDDVLRELANDIKDYLIDELRISDDQIILPSRKNFQDGSEIFSESFIPQVLNVIGDKNLVLLIDEFDVLGDHSRDSALKHFFPYLQSIIFKQKQLFIIPVVGRRLDDMPNLLGLFREAPNQEIGLLEEKSAVRLITEPARNILEYEPEAIQTILGLTAGHPYFTQVLCFALFSQARDEQRWRVNREDVECAVDDAIVIGEGGLAWFWDGLPTFERVIFSAVAEAQRISILKSEFTIQSPLELLEKYGVAQTEDLRRASRALKESNFLTEIGNLEPLIVKLSAYKVTIELVRRWLIKRHPLRQELEDLGFFPLGYHKMPPGEPVMGKRLEIFRSSYRNLQLAPLLNSEELNYLWVDYGNETIDRLIQLLEDSFPGNDKVVFAGNRGCGKSTLLAELSRRLEQKYFVVFFSIADMIEMSDIDHVNILFSIAVQLMEQAEIRSVSIEESVKEQVYKWFTSRTHTTVRELRSDTGSAGISFFNLITSKLKTEAGLREEIKTTFERRVSELISQINRIATVIQQSTSREILVIIDDLDKLDINLAYEVYRNNIKPIFQPDFRMVLTAPIAVVRDISTNRTIQVETNNKIVVMPIIKLFAKGKNRQPDAEPLDKPLSIFKAILYRRIPPDLIEPEVAEELIIYSGGIMRELIRILHNCCQNCLQLIRRNTEDQDVKINQLILQSALKEIRNDFSMSLGRVDYQILNDIFKYLEPDDVQAPRFLDLLHGLYIIEYHNDDIWYDVHPVVVDLLKRKGLIE